jgi:two-component system sensor histidine kinase ChiS
MATGAKVLVIDDDQDFQASVRSLLETHEYMVIEANSAKEGLEKLVEHRPDVVVLDIMMENDFAGYGVNQAIKYKDEFEGYRKVPIIMVSAIQETPEERFRMASEVEMIRPDIYLTKPLEIPKFLQTVKRLVDSRRSRGVSATE